MSNINLLPFTVVQKLQEAGIPRDSLIFYQNNRWVYQVRHAEFNNNQLRYQTIDSLGPFGEYLNKHISNNRHKFLYRYSFG